MRFGPTTPWCKTPYSPKWEIDFAPINFRIQPGFINQSLNLNGLLTWRVDLWASDAWNNVYGYPGSYPGEGMLIYPGSTVGIPGAAPSMRLKWLRDGVDDFDYIQLLKAAGQGPAALKIAATVGANWSNWTRDPNALYSARHQLGQLLDSLGGGQSSAAPAAPVNPSPANAAGSTSTNGTLTWTGDSKATSYDVYFDTSSNPLFAGNTASASFSAGSLQSGTTYYWRVVAKNSSGSTSSATWSFTTQAATPPRRLRYPVRLRPTERLAYLRHRHFLGPQPAEQPLTMSTLERRQVQRSLEPPPVSPIRLAHSKLEQLTIGEWWPTTRVDPLRPPPGPSLRKPSACRFP